MCKYICSINTNALKRMIALFKPIVNVKTYCILSRALIKTDESDGSITIVATDLNSTIFWDVNTGTGAENEACVYTTAEILCNMYRFIKNVNANVFKNAEVCDISTDAQGRVTWTIGEWKYVEEDIKGAEEYPALDKTPLDNLHGQCVDLKSIVRMCGFCVSDDSTRKTFNGIYHSAAGFTSTDGHRLTHVEESGYDGVGVIIPCGKQWALGLDKAASFLKRPVMYHTTGKTIIEEGNVRIEMKNVEDRYPDFSKVLPTQWYFEVTVTKTDYDLLSSVCQSSGRKDKSACVISGDGKAYAIRDQSEEHALDLTLSVDTVVKGSVMVNLRYMLEGIKYAIETEGSAKLCIRDEDTPILIVCNNYKHALMPIVK